PQRTLGAELLEPAPREPTRDRPAAFERIEGGSRRERMVERFTVSIDAAQDRLRHPAEASRRVERLDELERLAHGDGARTLQLSHLEHRHAQGIAELAANALGAMRVPIDVAVEAFPVAQDAVHERRAQRPIAWVHRGCAFEVVREPPIAEALCTCDVAQHANGELDRKSTRLN